MKIPTDYRKQLFDHYRSSGTAAPALDENAPERMNSLFRYWEYKLGRWLPADREASIVELGCGGGNFLLFLLKRGYRRVEGIDISAEQIEVSRRVAPGARTEVADLLAFLGESEAKYDCVVAMDVIEHLDKGGALQLLELCYLALKPGGRLIIQTPNAASPWGMEVRYGDFTHECCFTARSLGNLLRWQGFEAVEAQEGGPAPLGAISSIRYLFWKLISCYYRFYSLVETGGSGEGILTRVFQVGAVKPAPTGVDG